MLSHLDKLKELLKTLPDDTRLRLAEYTAEQFLDGVKTGQKNALNKAIERFRSIPEEEIMTKNVVILELQILRDI